MSSTHTPHEYASQITQSLHVLTVGVTDYGYISIHIEFPRTFIYQQIAGVVRSPEIEE